MEENGTKDKRENHFKEGVADILRVSMIELAESDIGVFQRIVDLADAGFFEEHQTSGSLRVLADELLSISMEGGKESEGK
ncbi:hypothetical protein ACFLWS_06985 [Chloroflexota bacterium]